MDEYLHMDSQVGSSLISDFSSFISKVGEGDLTNKFTTNEIFRSREHLSDWVRGMAYDLGFVVVIVRSDIATSIRGRKTFVILGCERGGKYRKYKADAVPSVYDTRKCECPFRLKGKPCSDGDGWVLKVMRGHHNHELAETLVGHPYAGRCADDSEVVTDLFWTHPEASNFTWALEKLKGLFLTSEGAPKVIVSNRDLALMNVIANTWIIPYSTYFVQFWTNKVMHLGNTTTNRVESAHWSLKKVLGNSMGDLCSCWDSIHNVVILQHNKIKESFQRSLLLTSNPFKGYIYKKLIRRVSQYALDLIAKELETVQQIGLNSSKCGCVLRRTFGVSYACELARYDVGLIPLGEFHIMWRRLHFSNVELNETEPELSIKDKLKQVEERFNEVDIEGKVTIKQKLLDIICPTLTSMVPPLHKVKTKGAQKSKVQRRERSTTRDPSYFEYVDVFHSTIESSTVKSKLQSKPNVVKKKRVPMIDQFHSITHPFIMDVVDVVADCHCGYRCIAASLGLGEDSWSVIRNDLYKELSQWRNEYASLVGGYDRLEEWRNSLLVQSQSRVKLQEGCHLPMVNIISSTYYYPEARAWSSIYTSRMQAFAKLMGVTTSYVDLGDS
ncbi:uncharacterized protein LOC128197877 [Vigna angularis]|uniref:uncharacterized protein LOC128197877 n=1 Tax=Phaseolus angularis TaxID=3914 RepID=UPI0022B308CE|nr:uncharacterized protein LOC128197877 [Vigna angularis]